MDGFYVCCTKISSEESKSTIPKLWCALDQRYAEEPREIFD